MSNTVTADQLEKINSRTNKLFYQNVFGTLLPILLSVVPICLFSMYDKIFTFISNGTICICSASFFTISNFLLTENSASITLKSDKWLGKYSLPFLLFSASIYCFIYAVDGLKLITVKLNMCLVWLFSLSLFVLSLYSLYRGIYLESLQNPPKADAREENQEQVTNIMSQLH